MVTLSSNSKKSKSSALRMAAAVRSSGGIFDHALNAAWARRNISSMSLSVPSFVAEVLRFTFVCQSKLVLQIGEAVVDRRRGQHQNLGLDALLMTRVHEPLVAGFAVLECVVVAEIVGFVDDDES